MFNRLINIPKNNSFFLFGPRGVGKSSLLKERLPNSEALWIDLLDPELEERLSLRPGEFKDMITAQLGGRKWVVIDEIQKVPKLLNFVHQLIESQGILFALTGSSARRLKQKGTNLLAGRAWNRNLHPLSIFEAPIATEAELVRQLEWGGLPKIYGLETDADRTDYLRAYAQNYVKQEIQSEQWVRRLDPFRKFLPIASQMNGKILNYSAIARDVGADANTIQTYYQILEDTLMGFELPGYDRSVRKQQRKAPKFYLFDTGVKRALDRTLDVKLKPSTSAFGEAFEHFIFLELKTLHDIRLKDYRWSYLRTKDGLEIDLILERPGLPTALIEIKSATNVHAEHASSLIRVADSFPGADFFLLSRDPLPRSFGNIQAMHFRDGIEKVIG